MADFVFQADGHICRVAFDFDGTAGGTFIHTLDRSKVLSLSAGKLFGQKQTICPKSDDRFGFKEKNDARPLASDSRQLFKGGVNFSNAIRALGSGHL